MLHNQIIGNYRHRNDQYQLESFDDFGAHLAYQSCTPDSISREAQEAESEPKN